MGGIFNGPDNMQGWERRGAMRMPQLWTPKAPVIKKLPYIPPQAVSVYSQTHMSVYSQTQTGIYVPDKPKLFAVTKAVGNDVDVVSQLRLLCPGLDSVRDCPALACDREHKPIYDLIIHLNDYHRWPREKVADWLEVISLDNPDINLTIIGGKNEAGTDKAAA